MDAASGRFEEKETGRLEAFSDGVFAFAITLLVLYLKDPTAGGATPLLQGLLEQWPTFLALVTSFMTILIMWVNHHNMFNWIKRVDTQFMFLNGFLLFFVVLTPFTTSLVATHIISADAGVAAAVYSGSFLFIAIAWNLLWRHASDHNRLLGKEVTEAQIKRVNRSYYVGPAFYVIALMAALFNGLTSLIVILLVAAFYAITASRGGQ
jgi:uncharacterized membrane protein